MSANHLGSKARALEIIRAARESGADAIKFQHFTPETITVRSNHPDFRVSGGTLWDGRQLADLYAEAMTPWEWTEDLVAESRRIGIDWLSSPFDISAVEHLEEFDIPMYKIASFEIVDLPLIRYVASKGKPLILSTGMSSLDEIDIAVKVANDAGAHSIVILRCNSAYPAPIDEMNLNSIPVLIDRFKCCVGLSDHTIGTIAAISAVALGATVIEKHFTLSRADGGPDATFSIEPVELKNLVRDVRAARKSLGEAHFGPTHSEEKSLLFRRSLRAVAQISVGELITEQNVRSVRPAGGLHPDEFSRIVGKAVRRDVAAGEPITDDLVI